MKKKTYALLSLILLSLTINFNNSVPQTQQNRVYYQNKNTTVEDYFNNHSAPDTFGSKKGDIIEYDSKYYQNYDAGYVELNLESSSIRNHAGRNISNNGTLIKVDLDLLLSKVAEGFATVGRDNFGADLNNPDSVKVVIKEQMKKIYTDFYNKDIILGTVGSDVKAWDGFIVQDFFYGDSSFAFDGERYGGSFIFYNYRLNEVETEGQCYVVSDVEAEYWDSNKTTLGYPTSNLINDTITLPGSNTKEKVKFQIFEGGFTYRDTSTETVVYRNGYKYNAESKSFIAEATPKVDSRYGKYVQEFANEDRSTVVKVYKKGSIICTLEKGEYKYEYRPARIYKSLTEYDMYDVNVFLEDVGSSFETSYDNQEDISLKLKKKYKDLYKQGFFVGFKESSFHRNWNGVDAQQFILGDSTANPWEGDRTNVAALVYNKKDNTVVLLANNPLYLWNKGGNFNIYGAPLKDAFVVGNDTFQEFEGGLLVILNNNVDSAFLYKGTYEDYIDGKESFEKPTFGSEFTTIIETPANPVVYLVAVGVPSVVVAVGIVLVAHMINKKRKMKENSDQ